MSDPRFSLTHTSGPHISCVDAFTCGVFLLGAVPWPPCTFVSTPDGHRRRVKARPADAAGWASLQSAKVSWPLWSLFPTWRMCLSVIGAGYSSSWSCVKHVGKSGPLSDPGRAHTHNVAKQPEPTIPFLSAVLKPVNMLLVRKLVLPCSEPV